MLYCPYCAVKNRIDTTKLQEIVNRTEFLVRLRTVGRS
jgi:hypothetical protein